MIQRLFLIMLLIVSQTVHAEYDTLDFFDVEGVYVNKIYTSEMKVINKNYKYVVAYAENTKDWRKDSVGIFLVSKDNFEILDIFPSERHKDFIPVIRVFSDKELVISVYSDYGELKKVKYIINLNSKTKLVSRIELDAKGIPDDLL